MRPHFQAVWANDVSPKKAAVYCANFGDDHFHLGGIEEVRGETLPTAALGWASFPCQDLSLAGNIAGIRARRSGLVWEWLRVIDEMGERRPPILAAENVTGLVSAKEGAHYRALHEALRERGYRAGALELDAIHWLPQSRPRIFVVGVREEVDIAEWCDAQPGWAHSPAVVRAARECRDFVWWKLPRPRRRATVLADLLDFEEPCLEDWRGRRTLELISPRHRVQLDKERRNGFRVAPGYKRIREGRQVLELRFDGVAGCLRTPAGGSSRQFVVLEREGALAVRLLTVREAARLMGVPESFVIPGRYNDGYRAMGDAVAAPVVAHLAGHLLGRLAKRSAGG
jgi:DNA (cytosine-5)-methyltransferase 1